jgi:DNA-binding LacI/PurR family transcriptional regulator
MSDIARKTGVSKNTVSLALRNDPRLPERTKRRIRQAAKKMGYRKNPIVAHLMVQLRAGRSPRSQPSLALLNANLDSRAFASHPTVPVYVGGCRRRAKELGYFLDEFWLHDPKLDGNRMNRILRARNIRGLIVVGLMNETALPGQFQPTWEAFPAVVTGVRTQNPALSFASVDHHMLVLNAIQKALELGYRRPALALDSRIDRLVEGRFTAGLMIAQQRLPMAQRISPFYFTPEVKESAARFHSWLRREKPDVILTLYNVVRHWIEDAGLVVPRDIALIQLERRSREGEWAGMNQHNDLIGEAAVDMVIAMIHNNQQGAPSFPRATLVGGSWVDGRTCPRRI